MLISVLVSLVLHEFSHAVMADLLGDRTARDSGRITLNPLAHLEVLGLLMIFFGPIGWARPVPVNPGNFRNPRLGMIVTALAGPISNFILACLCLFVLRLKFQSGFGNAGFLVTLLQVGAFVNLSLFIFNLIPLPPLDGSRVVANLLTGPQRAFYAKVEFYGPFILLMAFIIPQVRNDIFYPFFDWFANLAFGLFGLTIS